MSGAQLRALRESLGLTQAQMGACLGKGAQAVSSLERGRYRIDRTTELLAGYVERERREADAC